MPTNLPPECAKIEAAYREATDPDEKIELLEALISAIPKHKGTDHLRADLRRRLSRLQEDAKSGKGKRRVLSPYRIPKEGAGQVVVLGTPNVGKSSLVAAVTNSNPEISPSPFSTWEPTPGMMQVLDVQVQLIDTPPLNPDYVDPDLYDLVRRCDLVLLMVDVLTDPLAELETSVALLEEHHVHSPHRASAHETDVRTRIVPHVLTVNKVDDDDARELLAIFRELLEEPWPMVAISVTASLGIEELARVLFDNLGVIRLYAKPPGSPPDMEAPFVLPRGSTVEHLAAKVHKEVLESLTTARVWGSAEHDGIMVGRDHVLADGDIVELRT